MYRLFLITLSVAMLNAEIVDRIAITIGRQVITELQIDEEIRVTAFLNHEPISRDLSARRAAAAHLVSQLLVKHELELSHYPPPETEAVDNYLKQVRADFASDAEFNQALASYKLSEDVLRDHLALQVAMLQFVEVRFRPDVDISDVDIESKYNQQVTAWKAAHPGAIPPKLAEWRDSIRKALIETRTDEVLDNWLRESRKQFQVVYLDKSLE